MLGFCCAEGFGEPRWWGKGKGMLLAKGEYGESLVVLCGGGGDYSCVETGVGEEGG